jgi:hypothetical protein
MEAVSMAGVTWLSNMNEAEARALHNHVAIPSSVFSLIKH